MNNIMCNTLRHSFGNGRMCLPEKKLFYIIEFRESEEHAEGHESFFSVRSLPIRLKRRYAHFCLNSRTV